MPLEQQIFKRAAHLMGNHFELSVVANILEEADACINAGIAEIQRIEQLLTTFREDSETNLVNASAGLVPVVVSNEMFQLVERSLKISFITHGAFDITYGSIDKNLWNFNTTMTRLPDPVTAKKMVHLINYQNVVLDKEKSSIFLSKKGMRIGFGGIGKGYAADMAKRVMIATGATAGIVNASGDLTCWGLQPNGEEWTVGIVDPNQKETVFSYLKLTGLSVATSGNYEKFVMIDGKKYSHTINPTTGLPITGIKSVTMIAPTAELADAMATPVMIMGVKAGLRLINQIKSMEAIIIDDNDNIYTSRNIHLKK